MSEVLFWKLLGFDDDQLETVEVDETMMFTPIVNARGECMARHGYTTEKFGRNAKFAYLPTTDGNIIIECDYEMKEVPATPQGMEMVFKNLLERANYESRFRVLNNRRTHYGIIPSKLKIWKNYICTSPLNLFPLDAGASHDGENLEVYINTKRGQGAIVELRLPEDNVFGLSTLHLGYDKKQQKFKEYTVQNNLNLGIRGQHAVITSGDFHMSRSLVKPALSNKCLVAIFPAEDDKSDQPFLALNRLASTSTYDNITFQVFSTHMSNVFRVSKELYSYLFCFEIRGFN